MYAAPRAVVVIVTGMVLIASCSSSSTPANSEVGSAVTPSTTTHRPTSALPHSATSLVDSTTTSEPPIVASALLTGEAEMVFDWSADRCRPDNHPDLPTRAFRDSSGMVNLILSSPTIHRMVGPNFDSLVVDCDPLRLSSVDPDPSHYDFLGWMGSLYTEDGETIHAVIHNEFHGDDASLASSRRDFSVDSSVGGWTYLGRVGSDEVQLEFINGDWRHDGTLCIVADWGSHPDTGCESIRRWSVPESGELSIWASIKDLGIGGGNGVDVGIRHNDLDIWTGTLEEGDGDVLVASIEETVTAGDKLDFWVSSRGDASFDATEYLIEINYGERPCTVGLRDACQMMALTSAVSIDGGATFQTAEQPERIVAVVPERYVPDGGQMGLWQPSNIVRHPTDGYFYMFAQIDVHQGSRNLTGLCLLRSEDLSDASSWRAWDGEGFDYQFLDPYSEDTSDAAVCPSVLEAPGWSLTYNTFLESFVIVSEMPRQSPPGVYFRTSADLIHWSSPKLIVDKSLWKIGFANDFETPFEAYPSILDPESESMSFDTVGETAYLYFTRINSYDPLDFDLLRTPIRFEK